MDVIDVVDATYIVMERIDGPELTDFIEMQPLCRIDAPLYATHSHAGLEPPQTSRQRRRQVFFCYSHTCASPWAGRASSSVRSSPRCATPTRAASCTATSSLRTCARTCTLTQTPTLTLTLILTLTLTLTLTPTPTPTPTLTLTLILTLLLTLTLTLTRCG